MKLYEVTAPSGGRYFVAAADDVSEATAIGYVKDHLAGLPGTWRAELPDGRSIVFTNSVTNDTASKFIQAKFPEYRALQQSSDQPFDTHAAFNHASLSVAGGLLVAALLFWITAGRQFRKRRASPPDLGIWWAGWISSVALGIGVSQLVGAAQRVGFTPEVLYLNLLMNSIILPGLVFLLAYALGWAFRWLRPVDEEAMYQQAHSELGTEQLNAGVWAMAVARSTPNASPEALYIRLRVRQMRRIGRA